MVITRYRRISGRCTPYCRPGHVTPAYLADDDVVAAHLFLQSGARELSRCSGHPTVVHHRGLLHYEDDVVASSEELLLRVCHM